MKFIVGIGNPGKKYEGTRHNVGFEILDRLAAKHSTTARCWKEATKLQAFIAEVGEAKLVKPLTFVNRTGESIAGILQKYHPESREILLVSDDVNLDFGKLRIRLEGSAGGHHGLESVTQTLETENFPRLRFGVRNAGMPQDLNQFVLEKFARDEKDKVADLLERAVLVCESWLNEGFEPAMRKLSQLQG